MDSSTSSKLPSWIILACFFSFFLLPSSIAFDCNSIENTAECNELKSINESLIANFIYTSSFFADHKTIQDYNSQIITNQPTYNKQSSGSIKDAWVEIFSINPSVKLNDIIYVPNNIKVRTDYGYSINIPETYYNSNKKDGQVCERIYYLDSQSASLNIYANSQYKSNSKISNIFLTSDADIKAVLTIFARIRVREYDWDRYCCRRDEDGICTKHCYDCDYDSTSYYTNSITLEDLWFVALYENNPFVNLEFISKYYNSSKAKLEYSNSINFIVSFNNSNIKLQNYEYSAEFYKEQYYFLQLVATSKKESSHQNLILYDNIFYIADTSECNIKYSGFFETVEKKCDYEYIGEEVVPIEQTKGSNSWIFILKLGVFIFVLFGIYKLIKKYWKLV